MMKPVHHRPSRAMPSRQSGVVLIVALVMLVVIGLASVSIMRNAISADIVSDNARRQNQALQGAQMALRFCENRVLAGTLPPAAAITDSATQTENWQVFTNWTNKNNHTVASDTIPAPANTPTCMAQFRTIGAVGGVGGTNVVVTTARGFSENYVENNTRQTQAGSVVWLQSIVQ